MTIFWSVISFDRIEASSLKYEDAENILADLESKKIPIGFDYNRIKGLANEAREKLIKIQPVNLGQASRIAGVSPSDISVLLVFLQHH